jgi:hypothetical protein
VNDLQKVKDVLELWVESLDAFAATTTLAANSFKQFFCESPYPDQTSPYKGAASCFQEAVDKLHGTVIPTVRQLFASRCLQPITAIIALVHPLNIQLSERKQLLLDFDSYKARIQVHHESGRDSLHPKVIKTALKLDEVAKQLYALQLNILACFQEYEKARSETFGPEFASFVACLFHLSSFSADLVGCVVPTLPQAASSLYILESNIPQNFLELNSASLLASVGTDDPDDGDSTRRLPPALVLSRSEFAGGSHGGYSGYSAVLPEKDVYEPEASTTTATTVTSSVAAAVTHKDATSVEEQSTELSMKSNPLLKANIFTTGDSIASVAGFEEIDSTAPSAVSDVFPGGREGDGAALSLGNGAVDVDIQLPPKKPPKIRYFRPLSQSSSYGDASPALMGRDSEATADTTAEVASDPVDTHAVAMEASIQTPGLYVEDRPTGSAAVEDKHSSPPPEIRSSSSRTPHAPPPPPPPLPPPPMTSRPTLGHQSTHVAELAETSSPSGGPTVGL